MRIDNATTASPTGLPDQKPFAEEQEHDRRNSNCQYEQIDVADLTCKPDRPVEEVVAATGYAEQARQLAHYDCEPGPRLEADENAVADQTDENAELEKPGDQAKHRHRECRKARDLCEAYRVPSGQRPDAAGDHERDCGGRADRKLAGRPKQRIAQAAKHIAVNADLRRQPGKARIGQ